MADEQKSIADMSFKEASIELEQIVRSLENSNLELEDSLAAYTRGVELVKSLRERLDGAEQRVRVLEGDLAKPIQVPDGVSAPATAYINE